MSEISTKSFQDYTVERIVKFFNEENKKCYLLADETGLGKTIVARNVIMMMADSKTKDNSKKNFRVLYIAPNLVLAKRNVEKLKLKKLDQGWTMETINTENRLSMLIEKEFSEEISSTTNNGVHLQYLAVSPAVSFFLEGGMGVEKKKVEDYFLESFITSENLEKGLFEEDFKPLWGECPLSDIGAKIWNILHKQRDTLLGGWDDDKHDICKRIVQVHECREGVRAKISSLLKDTEINKILEELLSKEVEYWVTLLNNENNIVQEYEKIIDKVITKKNINKIKVYDDFFTPLWEEGVIKEYLNKYGNKEITGDKKQVDSYVDIIKNILKDLKGDNPGAKRFRDEFWSFLYKQYDELYYYYLRLLATLQGVKNYNPDLVIFDEFQNYPGLFKQSQDNEETRNIKKIMETIGKDSKILMLSATPYEYHNVIDCGDGGTEENEFLGHVGIENITAYMMKQNTEKVNHKELFLRYHRSMECFLEVEDKDKKGECLEELKELVQEISNTLYNVGISRNERPVMDYNPSVKSLYIDPALVKECLGDIATYVKKSDSTPVDVRRFLSTPVYYADEKTEGENVNDESAEVQDSNDESKKCEKPDIKSINDKNNKLLQPGKVGLESGYRLRVRTQELLKDIFPKRRNEEVFIPPIFMAPTFPQKKLEGPFEKYDYSEYSKVILFSAYTTVPELLKKVVNIEHDKLLKDANLESLEDQDRGVMEGYISGILSNLCGENRFRQRMIMKNNGPQEVEESIINSIIAKFETEFAKRIIVICADKYEWNTETQKYWDWVVRYCECGDFSSVLDEFLYLLEEEYGISEEDISKENYLQIHLGKGKDSDKTNPDYAVAYTSLSKSDNLQGYIDQYQSPFYPFCFFLSSVAQEGLDFHWYSDFIVHWNVPATPIAMLQREGRINRYNCFALRKQLVEDLVICTVDSDAAESEQSDKKVGTCKIGDEKSKPTNWKELFELAEKEEVKKEFKGEEGFYPHNISLGNKALPIKRKCYYYPLSEEHFRWMDLMKNMEYYRSLFGAWKSEGISEEDLKFIEDKDASNAIMINLSPVYHERRK